KKEADGVQTLRMRISSPRQAGTLSIYVDSNTQVLSATVNNKQMDELKDRWGLFIDGFPKEGVELLLQVRTAEPLKIRLVDQSYGLPPVNTASSQQAPPTSAKPDATLVVKSFSL
ncbi:MAG TPA: hypothetical protein VN843_17910, partial [Anaerolineales bacterium]|nr:hypothetical protein [Anaerolineales bacterium]